jgi:error-prone DNA polymerase
MRLGMRYVKGMRESAARSLVTERTRAPAAPDAPFASVDDLARRVPELQKRELILLAEVGALNFLTAGHRMHRRDALWQVERAARGAGPLLETIDEPDTASPLAQMTSEERLVADFHGTGMTVGPHPMAYYRDHMNSLGVLCANDLANIRNGAMSALPAPSSAAASRHDESFVFLSLEDETGISNVIITPGIFEQNRGAVLAGKFVLIEGRLQNVDHVISVKADRVEILPVSEAAAASHDFH